MYMAVPLYLSWKITAVSVAATLVFGAPFLLLGGISYRLGQLNTSTSNDLASVINESLSSVKIILGYGNPGKNVDLVDRTYDAHRRVTLKSQTLDVGIPILYMPIGLSVMAVALIAGISRRRRPSEHNLCSPTEQLLCSVGELSVESREALRQP